MKNLLLSTLFGLGLISVNPALAIEELQLAVQSSNVVLAWPSTNGETYLVQFRTNLGAATWVTLADNWPVATNWTWFVHTNGAQPGQGGYSGTGGGVTPPTPGGGSGGGSGGTNTMTPGTGFYRVVRDGVHLFGLTNGMVLSGEVRLPIEFAVGSTDEIVGVTFYDGTDAPIIGASAYTNAAGGWVLDWSTPMSFNGDYTLYAQLDFAGDASVVSAPVTVTVDNVISFPNYFARMFGSRMWVYAQTLPNADYQIDMYGENTNYLGYFSGTTDGSGLISFTWSLGGLGDTNFYGVFTVDTSALSLSSAARTAKVAAKGGLTVPTTTATNELQQRSKPSGVRVNSSGGSSSSSGMTWAKEPSWSVGNSWAIAYSPLSASDPATTYKISQMMIGGDGGIYHGVVSTLGDYGLGVTMSPGNVSQSSAFEMSSATAKANFLGYMAESQYRHLYFFGHGSASAFGMPGVTINKREVQTQLRNFLNSLQPANYHPYRLVFIDGCDAGKGDLCEAFGIPAQTVNTNFFKVNGVESRAFVSFKNSVGFNPAQWTEQSLMMGGFFTDWQAGRDLNTCVSRAVNDAYITGTTMPNSVVIYGAVDLRTSTHTP